MPRPNLERSVLPNGPQRSTQTGWLGALRDPQLGRAIVAVHRHPGHRWTVASLANQAAMSRSAFAARFTQLVGEPAVQYVTRWRMQVALARLQQGRTTIRELAAQFGYGSEAAFSHAFKRVIGGLPRRGQPPIRAACTRHRTNPFDGGGHRQPPCGSNRGRCSRHGR